MSRPLRIEYPGAHYHIFTRGIRKENIYLEERDRIVFLRKLGETAEKFTLNIHCYALMDNHFHLYVDTPVGNITRAIHYLKSNYTNWFKAKYQLVGPLFQGRYKSILVEKETYALILSAYIHLNPVRSGMAKHASEYKWSSYNVYAHGIKDPLINLDPHYLDLNTDKKEREKIYKKIMDEYLNAENDGL